MEEVCKYCGKDRSECDGLLTLGTNPYQVEIHDNYEETWECEGSRQESAWDI